MPTPRNRVGCQTCRTRHVKCDTQEPACAQCVKVGADCVGRYSLKFRHSTKSSFSGRGKAKYDYTFAKNQPWCRTPSTLSFVNETDDLPSFYDQGLGDESQSQSSITSPFASHESSATSTLERPLQAYQADAVLPHNAYSSPPVERGTFIGPAECSTPGSVSLQPDRQTSRDLVHTTSGCGSANVASVYLHTPVWPLEDQQEAQLIRYFVEKLAPWFDLCDAERHFTRIVPQRAAVSPPLLNAVFAASARQLSRTTDFDEKISDQYHQACLEYMNPAMSDTAALKDENLLAATVILRFLEQLEVSLSGKESQHHLFGSRLFISAQERTAIFGGLRLAAYWVGLRQEIYMAFVDARPIMLQLEYCNIDSSFEPADECTWANRIIVHCADVLRYCFGDGSQSVADYENLLEYCNGWESSRPVSLMPVYTKPAENGAAFPEIWHLSDAAVTGCQHFHLAKILLAAHNPKMPRLGPKQRAALRETDEVIQQEVKMICGMAETNSKTGPNYVTACMLIAMAGDKFTDRAEQEALFRLLLKTEQKMAWPTLKAREHLQEAWGWTNSHIDHPT